MKNLFYIFIIILMAAGCQKEELDKTKLSKSYVEILIAKEKYSNNYLTFVKVKDSIFTKYNYSETKYNKDLNSLLTDNEDWQSFYDSSQAYLVRLRDSKK
ncbi:MAG: hypothetical protein JEY94_15895 [Melioribacteraceae bacterium]|nr:hypothetical protein [Melioribacteraceae bacterium]